MGFTSFVALVVAGAFLLLLAEGYNVQPLPHLANGPLRCMDQYGQQAPMLRLQPNVSHVVWKPIGSGRTRGFRRQSEAELMSIFSMHMTGGIIDDELQLDTLRSNQPLPVIEVGTVVGINETLPIDSPFFADTISNEDRAFIRRFVEDNGVGRCGTETEWTDLGELFFPRYFAGSRCEVKNCSIPTGLSCHPNLQVENEAENRLFVLNWDCCYVANPDLSRYVYQCGWRKVWFQPVRFCGCTCVPVL